MYLRLLSAVTRREVLINLALLPLIEVEYINRDGKPVDAITAKGDPSIVRVFSFPFGQEIIRVRSTDDSPRVKYMCQVYDESIG